MATKQQKLSELDELIKQRKQYLEEIEGQITAVTEAGNNALFSIHGEINEAENEKAKLLRQNYDIEQKIRENRRLLESTAI